MMRVIYKTLAALVLAVLAAVVITSVSPIYSFRKPVPFEGPDIFNPYAALDSQYCWQRALFHTHTRVKGPWPPNECPMWPQETWDALQEFGYDIVTFSNHNEITVHPFDTALQVNVYEHGYSPYKLHKLVFGSPKVIHWDPLVPVLASQRQFEMDYLGASSDFIQLNHPYRTWGTTKSIMEKLSGYEITELDSGISPENEYWDWALSAGHYSFGLANDDLHHPENHWCVALRCNFLCTPSGRYQDLKETLLGGCYYAMRIPDYGNGDWAVKYERNRSLPYVKDIGLDGDTVYLQLSEPAASIRVTGQDHATLAQVTDTCAIRYTFAPEDHYARLTAFFPEGEVIYTNPFARYDASQADSPANNAPQKVNLPLTVLYNLLLSAILMGIVLLLCKLFARKR